MKNSMFRFILGMVLTFVTVPLLAQDFMIVYLKDGDTLKLSLRNIKEITTSHYDANGQEQISSDYQHITTVHNEYIYDIMDIDSISFTKYNKELVKENVISSMNGLMPIIQNCSKIEEVEPYINQIKTIKGIEKAWSDGHELHVEIEGWTTISFHFNHDPVEVDDNPALLRKYVQRLKDFSRQKASEKKDGKRLKFVIANQQHFDESRQDCIKNLYIPLLSAAYDECNMDTAYVACPDVEFFYSKIWDYDIVFLKTHGGYEEHNKLHHIMTGDDYGWFVDKFTNEQYEKWVNEHDNLLEKYGAEITHIDLCTNSEVRGGKEVNCVHPALTEDFFNKIVPKEKRFSNPHSVFFNSSCHSLDFSDSFANVFVYERNLGTYWGYKKENHYSAEAGTQFFTNMLEGKSLIKAYTDLPANYRLENDKDGASLRRVPLTERTRSIFLVPVNTNEIDSKQAVNEFNNNHFVEVEGLATILNADDPDVLNAITFGFEYTPKNKTLWTNTITTDKQLLSKTIDKGNVLFRAKLTDIEKDNSYYYRAYTYDGVSFNFGELCEFTISELSTKNLSMVEGESREVKILVESSSCTVRSSDPEVATAFVQEDIITVNAIKAGEADIVVDGENFSATIKVKVKEPQKSFALGVTELEMQAGSVRSVSIIRGSGDFLLTNHNPDIAAGMIFESVYVHHYIEIEAYKPGTALIDVEDKKSGDVIQLTIVVTEGSGNPDTPHDFIIHFSSPELKEVCVYNWDTNGDGELSKAEAAAVTNIVGKMSFSAYKDEITSFDELQFFTGLTSIGNFAFSGLYRLTSIVIPDGVVTIGKYAFDRCSSLPSVNIPNSVTSIGAYAFQSCGSLASISVPSSVTYIGEGAFCSSGLTSIVIPNSISIIDYRTFYECRNLTSVTIPNTVTRIGKFAFSLCSSLTSINIPNSVTIIDSDAFYCCSSLTSITIPSSITMITSCAFSGCEKLTSVILPNTLKGIGERAFSECFSLTSVTIPKSVTRIDTGAFFNCTSLKEVVSCIEEPFAITEEEFSKYKEPYSNEKEFSSATLYVPKGCKAKYEATEGWKNFKSIVEMESDNPR